jgi:hypothetical protein
MVSILATSLHNKLKNIKELFMPFGFASNSEFKDVNPTTDGL